MNTDQFNENNQRLPDRVRANTQFPIHQHIRSNRLSSGTSSISTRASSEHVADTSTHPNSSLESESENNVLQPFPIADLTNAVVHDGVFPNQAETQQIYPGYFWRGRGILMPDSREGIPNHNPDWTANQGQSFSPLQSVFSNLSSSPELSSHRTSNHLSPNASSSGGLVSPLTSNSTSATHSVPFRSLSHALSPVSSISSLRTPSLQSHAQSTRLMSSPGVSQSASGENLESSLTGANRTRIESISQSGGKPRRRAVLIGITYANHEELPTISTHAVSTKKLFELLVNYLGYDTSDLWILCDQFLGHLGKAKIAQPDASNISKALRWLVSDSRPGDVSFLSFCGEVMRDVASETNVVKDVVYALLAADHPSGPLIWGADLEHMILGLSRGATMTILLDTQWSWDVVRLPFIYLPFKYNKHSPFEIVGALTPESWEMPELPSLMVKAIQGLTSYGREKELDELERQEEYMLERMHKFDCAAHVVCFAASPTKYRRLRRRIVGINPVEKGEYANSFITAIESCLRVGKPFVYATIILQMGEILSPRGSMKQTPQICCTRRLHLNERLSL